MGNSPLLDVVKPRLEVFLKIYYSSNRSYGLGAGISEVERPVLCRRPGWVIRLFLLALKKHKSINPVPVPLTIQGSQRRTNINFAALNLVLLNNPQLPHFGQCTPTEDS